MVSPPTNGPDHRRQPRANWAKGARGSKQVTYFSYASSSSMQKQWRSTELLIFCWSTAKYSWSTRGEVTAHFTSFCLCPQFLTTHCSFRWILPLMNSMHIEETSSAVILYTEYLWRNGTLRFGFPPARKSRQKWLKYTQCVQYFEPLTLVRRCLYSLLFNQSGTKFVGKEGRNGVPSASAQSAKKEPLRWPRPSSARAHSVSRYWLTATRDATRLEDTAVGHTPPRLSEFKVPCPTDMIRCGSID